MSALPYLDSETTECWKCHRQTPWSAGMCVCSASIRTPELAVTDVAKGLITLHHTYVGSEYNHDDEVLLDRDEASRLLAELTAALALPSSSTP